MRIECLRGFTIGAMKVSEKELFVMHYVSIWVPGQISLVFNFITSWSTSKEWR